MTSVRLFKFKSSLNVMPAVVPVIPKFFVRILALFRLMLVYSVPSTSAVLVRES